MSLSLDPLRVVDADVVRGGPFAPDDDHPRSGLASDMWWNGCRHATRVKARAWVRVLLEDLHMSDHDCDRFVASLSPAKAEDLIRRAVNGWGTENF
jgi:hypothetical protein